MLEGPCQEERLHRLLLGWWVRAGESRTTEGSPSVRAEHGQAHTQCMEQAGSLPAAHATSTAGTPKGGPHAPCRASAAAPLARSPGWSSRPSCCSCCSQAGRRAPLPHPAAPCALLPPRSHRRCCCHRRCRCRREPRRLRLPRTRPGPGRRRRRLRGRPGARGPSAPERGTPAGWGSEGERGVVVCARARGQATRATQPPWHQAQHARPGPALAPAHPHMRMQGRAASARLPGPALHKAGRPRPSTRHCLHNRQAGPCPIRVASPTDLPGPALVPRVPGGLPQQVERLDGLGAQQGVRVLRGAATARSRDAPWLLSTQHSRAQGQTARAHLWLDGEVAPPHVVLVLVGEVQRQLCVERDEH